MFASLKGWFGEKKTALNLWVSLNNKTYHRFHDLILPSHNGTTQIDHLLVSKYGFFIVETKNMKGWIFGDERSPQWTQSLYGKKFRFQNPLRQTYRQKKVLAEFFGIDEELIRTVVYFGGDCDLRTPLPLNVMTGGLGRHIKSFNTPKIDANQEQYFLKLIESYASTTTLKTSDHIKSLNARHSSSTQCPRCSSPLVKRTAKSGSYKGNVFLGCTNYPKCRYTKNL
ncbi:nuclease-related domain-containing protein [Vibrio agarivorans]|uniref:nuclease-related domain-containing protein n=1 Tax=Vibrio agarivorans TaxID=153622 RepID=UPI002232775E|nr:NERD domain-containing protein [Vibrio agarivorans]